MSLDGEGRSGSDVPGLHASDGQPQFYPHKWRPLRLDERIGFCSEDSPYNKCLKEDTDVDETEKGSLVMPPGFVERGIHHKIYRMEVRRGDIWIVTYPKCGTTWTSEIVWSLMRMDPGLKDLDSNARVPFLELNSLVPDFVYQKNVVEDKRPFSSKSIQEQAKGDLIEYAEHLLSPRIVKTHLPLTHLPTDLLTKAKVIYVARNPKDQIVSWYHHMPYRDSIGEVNIDDFAMDFIKGNLPYGDYFKHLKDHWAYRDKHPENFKFFWFEDMKKDFDNYLRELQLFLGQSFRDESHKAELLERCGIDQMREAAVKAAETQEEKDFKQRFFRKGRVNNWKDSFKAETIEELDRWIDHNLEGTDIQMPLQ